MPRPRFLIRLSMIQAKIELSSVGKAIMTSTSSTCGNDNKGRSISAMTPSMCVCRGMMTVAAVMNFSRQHTPLHSSIWTNQIPHCGGSPYSPLRNCASWKRSTTQSCRCMYTVRITRPQTTVMQKLVMYQMHSPACVCPWANRTARARLTKCCNPMAMPCFELSMNQMVQSRWGNSCWRLYRRVARAQAPKKPCITKAKVPDTTRHSCIGAKFN
mmetsp:Transcript_51603/g.119930  ORF Transcript_51603/g.119930 Transcript_51603/m.119930 type:complete len:214 (+) Transcript_51603:169-810(+)